MRTETAIWALLLATLGLPHRIAAQDGSADGAAQSGWTEILGILLVVLAVTVVAFLWFMRQRSKRPPPGQD